MSSAANPTLPGKAWTLGEYIEALISALGSTHPSALARMREVVGDREARIVLDDEAVDVVFENRSLQVRPALTDANVEGTPTGMGITDSATVLDLLDGYIEVADSILDGRIRVFGSPEDVSRMFLAIEILLDMSSRTPALQALAFRFQTERRDRRASPLPATHGSWYPFGCQVNELELLARNDLLPDPPDRSTALAPLGERVDRSRRSHQPGRDG
jgi:hypothetical protein